MSVRSRCGLALALRLVLAAAFPAAARANAEDLLGTYRLLGRVKVHAPPLPESEDEVRADAVLTHGAAAGTVRLRLALPGAVCDFDAALGDAGELTIAPGQRCPVDLASESTEGRAEARVIAGGGRIADDVLQLELTAALTGSVQIRSAGALGPLSKVLSLPGSRGRPVAFEGEASGRAAGRRDRSRAAQ